MKIHFTVLVTTFTVVSTRKKLKTNKERGTQNGDVRILVFLCILVIGYCLFK